MRRFRYWILDARNWNNHNYVLRLCGRTVQKCVQKKSINNPSFTQYAQPSLRTGFSANLYTFLYPRLSHVLHNKFMQNTSVKASFYTLSTGPITTTTYK